MRVAKGTQLQYHLRYATLKLCPHACQSPRDRHRSGSPQVLESALAAVGDVHLVVVCVCVCV
jgi:hypothetical protein